MTTPPACIVAFALVTLPAIGSGVLQQRRAGRSASTLNAPSGGDTTGTFVMRDSVYGHPQHQVTISSPVTVTKDTVTRGEYGQFVVESGYSVDNS